jgi:hypothetical protein
VSALLLLALAALSLPALVGSAPRDRLDPLDERRLAEAQHLRQAMGDSVWPGWGQAAIPYLVWNDEYTFLVGEPNPPSDWSIVAGDGVDTGPYFRRASAAVLPAAVRLESGWAAALPAPNQGVTSRLRSLVDRLPPFVARLVSSRAAVLPAEDEIAAALHQSFHAYQAQTAPQRYEAALLFQPAVQAMPAGWQQEVSLLARALQAVSEPEAAGLVREFLALRQARRASAGLDAAQVEVERQGEWLEGLPKYVELNIWRHAFIASDYQPLPAMAADPRFSNYQTFDEHWAAELATLEQPASLDGPSRLAYSGMAQAILLDSLGVDWKARALSGDGGVALEDLLAEAVGAP